MYFFLKWKFFHFQKKVLDQVHFKKNYNDWISQQIWDARFWWIVTWDARFFDFVSKKFEMHVFLINCYLRSTDFWFCPFPLIFLHLNNGVKVFLKEHYNFRSSIFSNNFLRNICIIFIMWKSACKKRRIRNTPEIR